LAKKILFSDKRSSLFSRNINDDEEKVLQQRLQDEVEEEKRRYTQKIKQVTMLKTFFFVRYTPDKKARVFDPGKPYQHRLVLSIWSETCNGTAHIYIIQK
jgi:hypothetical protein